MKATMTAQHSFGIKLLLTAVCIQLQWCPCLGNQTSTTYVLGYEGQLCTPISEDFEEVTTRILCAIQCDRHLWCIGFFHSTTSRGCFGADRFIPSTSDRCSSGGVNNTFTFYHKSSAVQPTTTPSGKCTADEDCTPAFPNTDCRQDGVCTCVAGYSFLPGKNTCVTSCPGQRYGDTFTLTAGYFVQGLFADLYRGVTKKSCMRRCIKRDWTCVALTYGGSAGDDCFLLTETKYGNEHAWRAYSLKDYYQRNCA